MKTALSPQHNRQCHTALLGQSLSGQLCVSPPGKRSHAHCAGKVEGFEVRYQPARYIYIYIFLVKAQIKLDMFVVGCLTHIDFPWPSLRDEDVVAIDIDRD